MSAPFFSVVIPTYNRSDLVTYAVESVLKQSCPELEVLVSDNGSTDDTAEVVGRIADPRVRYVQTPVHGPIADSWEFARLQARGSLIMMLSDDDALVPDALHRFGEESRRHQADFLFCKAAEYRDNKFPGSGRNTLACPRFTGSIDVVSAADFIQPLFSFRRRFEMHPSAFVFAKSLADLIAARCGRFFQTNGVEYFAWPMAAALARARVHIDAPLVVLGRTAKSWGSNLSLTNPGKERIEAFIADVEHVYRHAPLTNFTTSNMWAEGVLTAKILLPRELGAYELDEAEYLRSTARELKRRSALGVDVSREMNEFAQYLRQNPTLGVATSVLEPTERGLWQRLRSSIGNAGGRKLRKRIRANRQVRNLRFGNARSGFNVPGSAFGFNNVLESAEFLARVASLPAPNESRVLRHIATSLL
jgi:glycosyltransferase involved in cell wall biosynthesis